MTLMMMLMVRAPTRVACCSVTGSRRPPERRTNKSSGACHVYGYPQRRLTPVMAKTRSTDVVIVGGGVAGLRAAQMLTAAGIEFLLLEAEAEVGGRVRTERTEEGFLLDYGFQILLTAYPEAQEALAGYKELELKAFFAGARVRYNGERKGCWLFRAHCINECIRSCNPVDVKGEFHVVADPFRAPIRGLQSLANPIGSPWDKLLVGIVRSSTLLARKATDLFDRPETTISNKLKDLGFSESIVDRFFRPFLGGIFFDRSLSATSRLLFFVLRMLATGDNCLPAYGIGGIPKQMLKSIGEESVVCGCKVASIERDIDGGITVNSADGDVVQAKYGCADIQNLVKDSLSPLLDMEEILPSSLFPIRIRCIVATEGPMASRLLGDTISHYPSAVGSPVGTTCLYYSIDGPPPEGAEDPVLFLNGDGPKNGPINNMCFPSVVSSAYAPLSKTLVSVSLLGVTDSSQESLDADVRKQLQDWFPSENVPSWNLLKVFKIPYAQPPQPPPSLQRRQPRLDRGVYVAGDHRSDATLDGAMRSGRFAAEALLQDYDDLTVSAKAFSASK